MVSGYSYLSNDCRNGGNLTPLPLFPFLFPFLFPSLSLLHTSSCRERRVWCTSWCTLIVPFWISPTSASTWPETSTPHLLQIKRPICTSPNMYVSKLWDWLSGELTRLCIVVSLLICDHQNRLPVTLTTTSFPLWTPRGLWDTYVC